MESIELLGFSLCAWITIITVLTMFTVLLFTKLRADLVFLRAILADNIFIVNIIYPLTPIHP